MSKQRTDDGGQRKWPISKRREKALGKLSDHTGLSMQQLIDDALALHLAANPIEEETAPSEADLSALSNEVIKNLNTICGLLKAVDDINERIDELADWNIKQLFNRVDDLETAIAGPVEKRFKHHDHHFTELYDRMNAQQDTIDTLKGRLDGLTGRYNQLDADLYTYKAHE